MWKKMNMMSKMLLALLLPMFLIVAGICTYSYFESRNILNKQIMQTVTYMAESQSNTVYYTLKEKETLLTMCAEILGQKEMSTAERIALYKQVKANFTGIKSVFDGYEDKTCSDSQGVTEKEKPAGYDPSSRIWYKIANDSKGVGYTPAFETSNKSLSVDLSKKIIRNGQMVGVVGVDIDISQVRELAQNFKIGETGYVAILDEKGKFISHPKFGLTDNINEVDNGSLKNYVANLMNKQANVQSGILNGEHVLMSASPIGNTGWTFVIFAPEKELFSDVNELALKSITSSLIGLILIGLIIIIITINFVKHIKLIDKMAGEIAAGDLQIDHDYKPDQSSKDEIDRLIYSFQRMKIKLRSLISNVSTSAVQVTQSTGQFYESSQQSAEAANSVASSITHLVGATESQVKAVNEVVTIVSRMSENIQNVAGSANSMAGIADEAAGATISGKQSVDEAVAQMDNVSKAANRAKIASSDMEKSSDQIGQIVEMISNIAGQTNLLALNAAIEAARAGNQGRGFAVVAEEVRKLAEQSDQAARQITELVQKNHQNISHMVTSIEVAINDVNQGNTRVYAAGEEFKKILDMVNNLVSRVKQISSSLDEISSGSQRIVVAVNNVDEVCKGTATEFESVSAAVEEQSASMQEIASSCSALSNLAEKLDCEVQKFKL